MAVTQASTSISEQLGLDSEWRESQLRLAALDEVSTDALQALGGFLRDPAQAAPVATAFLDYLGARAETAVLLRGFDRQRLQRSLAAQMGAWVDEFGSVPFFERQIGLVVVHVRLGVSLGLYLAALGYLCGLLLEQIERADLDRDQRLRLIVLVARLISLDTLIAGEVYRRALARLDRRAQHGIGLGLALEADAVLERDALTGAVTRRVMMDAVDRALDTARKSGQGLTLILLEIDEFDQLNEIEGQEALRLVRRIIKASVREFDLIGRAGTQMFAVLLEGASLHTAHQVADRVRRHVADAVPAGASPIKVSQGLADSTRDDDQQRLFERCYGALARAREGGGNCVVEASALAAGR